jgi:hypothetical protein
MPQPRFQTSINDAFGAPGVYIKPLAVTAPVRGVFFGVTGLVGQVVRGPVNTAVRCDSFQRFTDVFGGRDYGVNGGSIISDVWWALQQKQFGTFYVVRVASTPLSVPVVTTSVANSGGTWAAGTYYFYVTATNAVGETPVGIERTATVVLDGTITVSWTQITNATGYKIYYGTTSGTEALALTVNSGSTVSHTFTAAPSATGAYPTNDTTGVTTASYTARTASVGGEGGD